MNLDLNIGQVAVLRTDTLYGLVAKVSDQKAVEKVYALKGRDFHKPCIILVSDKEAIGEHGKEVEKITKKYSTPTTVIVPKTTEPEWLTRGGDTVAYRIPQDKNLQALLKETGPLIAPSANPQGLPPARTLQEAKSYFGDQVDIYLEEGEVPKDTKPSRIIEVLSDGTEKVIR